MSSQLSTTTSTTSPNAEHRDVLESNVELSRSTHRTPSALDEGESLQRVRHLSLIGSLCPRSSHLLIHGPPKSGVSSLLMDFACSLASLTPCRCDEAPCRCNAVILFRPNTKNIEEGSFPLPCQSLDGSVNRNDCDVVGSSVFTTIVLNRIQVHHVAHVRDMYSTLLKIQGRVPSEQPWGGILVDDVDKLVGSDGPLLHLSQLLALLVDTVNVIQQQRTNLPKPNFHVRLAVSLHQALTVQGGAHNITHFWKPSIMEIRPHPSPVPSIATLSDHMATAAHFFEVVLNEDKTSQTTTASFISTLDGSLILPTGPEYASNVYYAIVHRVEGRGVLVWTRSATSNPG